MQTPSFGVHARDDPQELVCAGDEAYLPADLDTCDGCKSLLQENLMLHKVLASMSSTSVPKKLETMQEAEQKRSGMSFAVFHALPKMVKNELVHLDRSTYAEMYATSLAFAQMNKRPEKKVIKTSETRHRKTKILRQPPPKPTMTMETRDQAHKALHYGFPSTLRS